MTKNSLLATLPILIALAGCATTANKESIKTDWPRTKLVGWNIKTFTLSMQQYNLVRKGDYDSEKILLRDYRKVTLKNTGDGRWVFVGQEYKPEEDKTVEVVAVDPVRKFIWLMAKDVGSARPNMFTQSIDFQCYWGGPNENTKRDKFGYNVCTSEFISRAHGKAMGAVNAVGTVLSAALLGLNGVGGYYEIDADKIQQAIEIAGGEEAMGYQLTQDSYGSEFSKRPAYPSGLQPLPR